jgi:hypothetical protein
MMRTPLEDCWIEALSDFMEAYSMAAESAISHAEALPKSMAEFGITRDLIDPQRLQMKLLPKLTRGYK